MHTAFTRGVPCAVSPPLPPSTTQGSESFDTRVDLLCELDTEAAAAAAMRAASAGGGDDGIDESVMLMVTRRRGVQEGKVGGSAAQDAAESAASARAEQLKEDLRNDRDLHLWHETNKAELDELSRGVASRELEAADDVGVLADALAASVVIGGGSAATKERDTGEAPRRASRVGYTGRGGGGGV